MRPEPEVFYRKVGRRYVPAGLNELPWFPPGYYLTHVDRGCTSSRRTVDPDFAAVDLALRTFADGLVEALRKASEFKGPRATTAKEREAVKAWQAVMGDARLLQFEGASLRDIADAGAAYLREKMREAAEKDYAAA